jgi:uncharacterized protein YbjT (DUF2867 family)
MPRILVTGGSGGLGSELTPRLVSAGYNVRVISRSAHPSVHVPGVEWAQADLETQVGLVEAVQGIDTIVNAASSTHQADVAGTGKLLEYARTAGVSHVIHVSIVGIDRMQVYPYYAQKADAEQVIRRSGVPWTIMRITQFHHFIESRYLVGEANRTALALPTDYQFQTIDTGEAAQSLVEVAGRNPAEELLDVGGPEVLRLGEMAQIWLDVQGLQLPVVHQDSTDVIAQERRAGYSTCPDHRYGRFTWAQWVERKYSSKTQTA